MIKNIAASLALALLVVGFATADTKTQTTTAKNVVAAKVATKSAKTVKTVKSTKAVKTTKSTKDCGDCPTCPDCGQCCGGK